jgi:hypothetical protein
LQQDVLIESSVASLAPYLPYLCQGGRDLLLLLEGGGADAEEDGGEAGRGQGEAHAHGALCRERSHRAGKEGDESGLSANC